MYLDTSVVATIYARETASEKCEAVLASAQEGFFSSDLLVGELTGALLAKERAGIITQSLRVEILRLIETHIASGALHLIALNGLLIREAAEVMTRVHPEVPLRTLDAIHLATYLSVEAGLLYTRDRRMIEAAKKLDIPLAGT